MFAQINNTASVKDDSAPVQKKQLTIWITIFLLSSLAYSAIGSYSSLMGLLATTGLRFCVCCVCVFLFKAVRYAIADLRIQHIVPAAIIGSVILWQVTEKAALYPTAFLSKGALIALAIAAIPCVFLLTLAVVRYCAEELKDAVRGFIRETTRFEVWFLGIAFFCMVLCCVVLYSSTNMFYEAYYQGKFIPYDVVFTSDSSVILQGNAFFDIYHVTNDLRQPLFGLFSMPVVLPAVAISQLLSFWLLLFPILINTTQIFLVLLTILIIVRSLGLEGDSRKIAVLLLCVTYPVMLFSMNIEQYVFAVFWLVCLLYLIARNEKGQRVAYLAALSSLVTSGIYIVSLESEQKWKKRIQTAILTFVFFFTIVILLNRQYVFITGLNYFKQLVSSYGGTQITLLDRMQQFSTMLWNLFLRPAAQWTTFSGHPAYMLSPVIGFQWGGLVVLLMAVLGFVLNRNNRFARLSFLFVALSIVLHVFIGWGAIENGMTLYTYYYLWAYFSLIFLGLEKILQPLRKWRFAIYGLVLVLLAVFNFSAMVDIVRFGITHYPV